jgi:hypothetical protein
MKVHSQPPFLHTRIGLILLLSCLMCTLIAFSQDGKRPKSINDEGKRPKSIDEGNATVTSRTLIKKVYGNPPPTPRRPAFNWVVIRPDIDDAIVKIDSLAVAKSTEGDFRKELPVGKKYVVMVSAGSDYETFTQSYTMTAKQPEIIDPPLKYKFGSVKIVTAEDALENARVLIDGKPQKVKLDKSSSAMIIDKVEPGARLITFDHPDYVLYERNAKIEKDTEYTWSFAPERPLVDLDIQTDADTTIYVDNEPKGITTSDGKLKRSDIKIGQHEVRLVKNGYEEYKRAFNFEFRKPIRINETLVPKRPSTDFHDEFEVVDASRWTIGSGGTKLDSGRLSVSNSPALCYATNTFYWDFTMQFNLKFSNNAGAAWVVRAKDPNNYYLFYLSASQGKIPNKFLTYIVHNNTFDPMKPLDSVPIVISANKGDEYTVRIEANKNVINHVIVPSAMNVIDKKNKLVGEDVQLGTFTDKNNTFLYGGFGFRSIGSEIFSVDDLYVKAH